MFCTSINEKESVTDKVYLFSKSRAKQENSYLNYGTCMQENIM